MWQKPEGRAARVGVVGTGFVARHFVIELLRREGWRLGRVLTRRPPASVADFPAQEALTTDLDAVVDSCDILVECTGDVRHATACVAHAVAAGRQVVTLDAEFHVTTGSAFAASGLISEAAGDQPGCLAELDEDVRAMGFEPLVYGNMKGFLDRDPTPESMAHWGLRQDYSLSMVTSFTDGTKLQIEQCLVANGLGAGIAREELLGPESDDLEAAGRELALEAVRLGRPISDYVLSRRLPHGVFVVARHDPRQALALRNLKLGEGPYYLLSTTYCVVHLELFKTISRMLDGRGPLLTNSPLPRIGVAAVAKRALASGQTIARGAGSFELRGICVEIATRPGHLPIGLADDIHIRRAVEPGQILTLDDVDLPESRALDAWREIEARVLTAPAEGSP